MKKLLIFGVVLMMASCLGTKKVLEKTNSLVEKEKIETRSDSTKTETINRVIDDEYTIPLATNDSLVNARIREALANFSAGKSSGTNSTRIYFDEDAMAFKIASIIGETRDLESSSSNEILIEKTTEEVVTEYAKTIKKMIPWWLYVVAAFFLLPHVVKVLSIFNPVVGLVSSRFKKKVSS